MYIEMTTFAIPSFIIEILKLIIYFGISWFVLSVVALSIYSWMTARAIEQQMKIDAEIDRLHK